MKITSVVTSFVKSTWNSLTSPQKITGSVPSVGQSMARAKAVVDRQVRMLEALLQENRRLKEKVQVAEFEGAQFEECLQRYANEIIDLNARNKALETKVSELKVLTGVLQDQNAQLRAALESSGNRARKALQIALGEETEQPGTSPDDPFAHEAEAEGAFEIVKLSFRGKNKWFFSNGTLEFSAEIADKAFLDKVDRREVMVAHGDVARVRYQTRSSRDADGTFHTKYRVLEVLEIIPPAEQLALSVPAPEPLGPLAVMLTLVLFIVGCSLPARADECEIFAYEYCQTGCDDLGEFVVEPFDTFGAATGALLDLDETERFSGFVAQSTGGKPWILIRRERISRPATRDAHWQVSSHQHTADIAALYPPGFDSGSIRQVFSTNDPQRPLLVVEYVFCQGRYHVGVE